VKRIMKKEMELLPEDQINAKFTKLKHEIKGIKEKIKKIWKHQKQIEDRTKGKSG